VIAQATEIFALLIGNAISFARRRGMVATTTIPALRPAR
jgi:hypothetical protein